MFREKRKIKKSTYRKISKYASNMLSNYYDTSIRVKIANDNDTFVISNGDSVIITIEGIEFVVIPSCIQERIRYYGEDLIAYDLGITDIKIIINEV